VSGPPIPTTFSGSSTSSRTCDGALAVWWRCVTHHGVRRPVKSFVRVPHAEDVRALDVWAPVGSWAGFERFGQLFSFSADESCLPDNDASPLARVSSLRVLLLSVDDDTRGLEALGALEDLEELTLYDVGSGKSLARLDWIGGLRGLKEAKFINPGSPMVTAPMSVLRGNVYLQRLVLTRVMPAEGAALFDEGFPSLRSLKITSRGDFTSEAVNDRRRDVEVSSVPYYEGDGKPEITGDVETGFWVHVDLATPLGFESNHDAAVRAERRLRKADPELAKRLRWDPEGDGVGVGAADPEDLRRFLDFVADL
jgi:hypothetical protein